MTLMRLPLLLTTLCLLLAGCGGGTRAPSTPLTVDDDSQCPLNLSLGQMLTLNLPSNPSTGFRWNMQDGASELLKSLGPELHSQAKGELVGAEGTSSWRFIASDTGTGRLLLSYQQPWQATGEAAGLFDCRVSVE